MDETSILIVEDELIIARNLRRKLQKMGYQVTGIASSSEATIESIMKKRPDIILMDIVIKGEKDGIETAQYVHKKFGIPVIYTTAYTDKKTLQRAETSGAYGYIIKPFRDEELNVSIRLALQKSKDYHQLQQQNHRDLVLHLDTLLRPNIYRPPSPRLP